MMKYGNSSLSLFELLGVRGSECSGSVYSEVIINNLKLRVRSAFGLLV